MNFKFSIPAKMLTILLSLSLLIEAILTADCSTNPASMSTRTINDVTSLFSADASADIDFLDCDLPTNGFESYIVITFGGSTPSEKWNVLKFVAARTIPGAKMRIFYNQVEGLDV